jgi:hypothetical protein
MTPELDDVLQHYGVKGMKWGKVKSSVKKKTDGVKETAKTHVNSIKRERSWNKTLSKANEMSTKDLQKASSRAQLENDMKRLSKKVGSSKEKKDYLKRGDMNDQELFRKVQRLRAKDSLNRNASEATKQQTAIAKKVVQVAAPLVLSYALTGRIGKKDLVNAALSASGAHGKAIKTITDMVNKQKKDANAKHSDELDDILLHLLQDEEFLTHYGVKGMKWGVVRSKIRKVVKARRAKQNKQVLDRHEKNKDKKTYKKLYSQNSKRYKSHLGAARKTQEQLADRNRKKVALALSVGTRVAIAASPQIKRATNAAANAARNPDNIRKAKNVVQAMKRSPIRYVDGKKMTNVINF